MKAFVEAGYELQLTELDIGVKKNNEAQFKAQAYQYSGFSWQQRNLSNADIK